MRIFFISVLLLLIADSALGQMERKPLGISKLQDNFYVYTTYNIYNGTPVPANGMYMLTEAGAVIFDCPWDTTQFQPLLDSIQKRHNKKVVLCIATHFHSDRTAGLEYYSSLGIKTYTTRRTDELSSKREMKRAAYLLNEDSVFSIGGSRFEVFYPGPGHAPDNIVIWFEKEKILYGGCLIKSADDNNLGNLGDANLKEYANTLENVKRRFKKPKHIIPGHGRWQDTRSLEHTLQMARKAEATLSDQQKK